MKKLVKKNYKPNNMDVFQGNVNIVANYTKRVCNEMLLNIASD